MHMGLTEKLKRFVTCEDGAAVVELVSLLAASVAVVLAAMVIVVGGTEDLAGETAMIAAELDATQGFMSSGSGAAQSLTN